MSDASTRARRRNAAQRQALDDERFQALDDDTSHIVHGGYHDVGVAPAAANPKFHKVGCSALACGPASSIGTRMPCGGTELITAASTAAACAPDCRGTRGLGHGRRRIQIQYENAVAARVRDLLSGRRRRSRGHRGDDQIAGRTGSTSWSRSVRRALRGPRPRRRRGLINIRTRGLARTRPRRRSENTSTSEPDERHTQRGNVVGAQRLHFVSRVALPAGRSVLLAQLLEPMLHLPARGLTPAEPE